MEPEDLEPRKKKPETKNLDAMSTEEMHDYIAQLEEEIVRVRAEIEARTARRGTAEAVFRK